MVPRRFLAVGALLVPAALLCCLVYLGCGETMVHVPGIVHLITVSTAGALAGAAAIAMSVIAVRLNDGRAVLLGFAFSVMAVLLVFHALATPDVLIAGEHGLVQAAGALNIPLGGLILAATALPALRRPRGAATALNVQFITLGAIVGVGTAGLLYPRLIPIVPEYESFAAECVFALGATMLLVLAVRAARTFLLTRRASDLLVT